MDKIYKESEAGCCPRFNPEPWDEKEITWDNKLFVKDHVRSIFHIPLNFGKVIKCIFSILLTQNVLKFMVRTIEPIL